MALSELLAWQWSGYSRFHASRANLLLHIVAVPTFLLGNLALLVGLVLAAPLLAVGGAAAMVIGLAVQGRGHKLEAVAPEPFTGPVNAVARLFLEQWVTFPRFVLSGNWVRALRGAGVRGQPRTRTPGST